MRSIEWIQEKGVVKAIDQSRLPGEFAIIEFKQADEIRMAIKTMIIRGAPIIGVSAFYAMALKANELEGESLAWMKERLLQFASHLGFARPTAVNLGWAVEAATRLINAFTGSSSELS